MINARESIRDKSSQCARVGFGRVHDLVILPSRYSVFEDPPPFHLHFKSNDRALERHKNDGFDWSLLGRAVNM